MLDTRSDTSERDKTLSQMSPANASVGHSSRNFKFLIASGGFLIDLCCIWPFIFCAFSFGLFFAIHPNSRDKVDGHKQIPTLSQTGKLAPESLFFTFGLHMEAVLLITLFAFVYVHFKNKINAIALSQQQPLIADSEREDDEEQSMVVETVIRRYEKRTQCEGLNYFCCCLCKSRESKHTDVKYLEFWNEALIWIGLVAAVLMAMVGSVSLDVETSVHGVLAFFMYLTAILHMVFFYFTIASAMGYTAFQINLVRFCLFVCVPFNIVMLAVIGVMYANCDNDEICEQAAIDLSPALEYTTTLALLAYVYSYREHLKDINILTTAAHSVLSPPAGTWGKANEATNDTMDSADTSGLENTVQRRDNVVYNPPQEDTTTISDNNTVNTVENSAFTRCFGFAV